MQINQAAAIITERRIRMDKFTKLLNDFTPQAREIIKNSILSAENLGSEYVGSEHILLSFFDSSNSTGSYLLKRHGVSRLEIISFVNDTSAAPKKTSLSERNFSQNARKIISGSVSLAKNLGLAKAGSEHILMMILRTENSAASEILRELYVPVSSLYCDCANAGSGTLKASVIHTKKFKALEKYSRELTSEKEVKKLDNCFERDEQMERISRILLRRNKNNPCLIGEAGVGKSAIVEGLAKRIYEKTAPAPLLGKRIFSLDLSTLLAGAKYRGDFEERLKDCLSEATNDKDVILFIDEIHSIMGTGAAEGAIDAASILKPELARGNLQLIGATTYDEYRSCIEKDAALERRFQKVYVSEPSDSQTRLILKGIKPKYEEFHGVRIPDSAIDEAIRLSKRYLTDRYFPDKAIDLIDEACSKVRISQSTDASDDMYDIFNSYVQGQITRDKYLELISEKSEQSVPVLSPGDIRELVSKNLDLPAGRISKETSQQYAFAEERIKQKILGQSSAIDIVMSALRRNRVDIEESTRPIGSFVFMGRSGVGKTALAKEISEEIFSGSLIRFDMSEFSQSHTVSRLIGSPAGYVGYENAGELTEKVRKKPYSVLLFDEIEKAHRDIYNLLLQILDTGFLQDSKGRRVSFKNTLIIMTTNLGVSQKGSLPLGFSRGSDQTMESENMLSELKKFLSVELINRIDECVYFSPLSCDTLYQIARNRLDRLKESLQKRGVVLTYSQRILPFILEKSDDKVGAVGARGVIRIIENDIKSVLTDEIINGECKQIKLTVSEGKFKVINTHKALEENAV